VQCSEYFSRRPENTSVQPQKIAYGAHKSQVHVPIYIYILYCTRSTCEVTFFSFFFSSFNRRSENFPVVRHTIFSTFRPRSPDKTRLDAIHLAGEKKSRCTRASYLSSCHLPIMPRGKRISGLSPVK